MIINFFFTICIYQHIPQDLPTTLLKLSNTDVFLSQKSGISINSKNNEPVISIIHDMQIRDLHTF